MVGIIYVLPWLEYVWLTELQNSGGRGVLDNNSVSKRLWLAVVFNLPFFYQDYEDSDRMDRYGRDGVNHLFRGKRTNHLLRGRRSTSGSKI